MVRELSLLMLVRSVLLLRRYRCCFERATLQHVPSLNVKVGTLRRLLYTWYFIPGIQQYETSSTINTYYNNSTTTRLYYLLLHNGYHYLRIYCIHYASDESQVTSTRLSLIPYDFLLIVSARSLSRTRGR